MAKKQSDLPFGSEFSPSQIDLARVLEFAAKHGGNWNAFEAAVRNEYFEKHKTTAYNRGKLANNTKLGMIAYGIIDREARLTDFGKGLWESRENEEALYGSLARHILLNLYRAKKRPSGHDISEKFRIDNGAAIPPNLIAVPNTESNSYYLRYCQERELPVHPARYPSDLPEYFIRMLSDPGDTVFDPFAGSCVTGEVAERLDRRWLCVELIEDYLKGALGRFDRSPVANGKARTDPDDESNYYRVPRPGILWNGAHGDPLAADGGKNRPPGIGGKSGSLAKPSERTLLSSEKKLAL